MKLQKNRLYRLMPFVLAAIFCEVFAALAGPNMQIWAADKNVDNDDRSFVTFYDDTEVVTYKTDAKTVKEALKRADIKVDSGDIVEPALDERITTQNFNINIYRAKKIVVRDGSRQIHLTTASRNTREIAKKAGIELRTEDELKPTPNDSFLESGMLTAYEVVRAKKVNFVYYCENLTIYTQAGTVKEFLKERGIEIKKDDWISHKTSDKISDEMNLALYRQGKQTAIIHEEIDFEEKVTIDMNRDKGYRQVTKEGVKGRRDVTYEIEMKDGVELSRVKISEIIAQAPEAREVTIGGGSSANAKATNLPAGSHEDWMAAAGISPSDYGYVNYIIGRESGWRTTASNGRYYGLYQTNLRSLSSQCPNWQNDPVCQLRAATNYANGRYGSWAQAYNFWVSRHWW